MNTSDIAWPRNPFEAEKKRRDLAWKIGLGVVVGLVLAWWVLARVAAGTPAGKERAGLARAHEAARVAVLREFPGAKKISSFDNSLVERKWGTIYEVELSVDGLNAFGGPVRKAIALEIDLDKNTYEVKRK